MSVNAMIEDRLAAVEAAVAELQKHRLIQTPAPDWLEQVDRFVPKRAGV